jgi:pimeloyl-ACP methyl ester carboxylesterase
MPLATRSPRQRRWPPSVDDSDIAVTLTLQAIADAVAIGFRTADSRSPQHISRTGRAYQPGIGPHSENAAVALVLAELSDLLTATPCGQFADLIGRPGGRARLTCRRRKRTPRPGGSAPESEPVWDEYVQLSPDGADHWPVVLAKLKLMWSVEPSFTNEQLGSIEAPTLIIIGDRDIVTPEHTVEMFRAIPHAQLCVVPNAEHGAMPGEQVLTFLQERASQTDQ